MYVHISPPKGKQKENEKGGKQIPHKLVSDRPQVRLIACKARITITISGIVSTEIRMMGLIITTPVLVRVRKEDRIGIIIAGRDLERVGQKSGNGLGLPGRSNNGRASPLRPVVEQFLGRIVQADLEQVVAVSFIGAKVFVSLILDDVGRTPARGICIWRMWRRRGRCDDEGVNDRLRSGHAVVLIGRVLLVHGEARSCAAIRFDEDGVTEDKCSISTSVGLGAADVGRCLVIVAVIRWHVVTCAL